MNAEIIAVGSELLTPFRIDTNSLFLTRELNKLGVDVIRKAVVGDDRKELRRVFEHALDVAELVICSGGLGPTEDDLTREAIAETLGRASGSRRRNPSDNSGALSAIWARDAREQCPAIDDPRRRAGAEKSARDGARPVD